MAKNKPPGKDGSESSSRTVGGKHGFQCTGKKKMGPGSGKNQGDGAGT